MVTVTPASYTEGNGTGRRDQANPFIHRKHLR